MPKEESYEVDGTVTQALANTRLSPEKSDETSFELFPVTKSVWNFLPTI